MLFNFSISKLSLNLILVAPFISQPAIYGKNLIRSYHKINCANFFHSFLYTKTNTITDFKESHFTKFQGYSPIYLNSMDLQDNYHKIHTLEEIKDPIESIDQKNFTEQLLFVEYSDISITITNCRFDNCYNQYGPGGAISFRKGSASLNIHSCQFIKCRAQYNAGAIFIQVSNGGWIQGNANITNSLFEECYDCKPDANYVTGVIQGFVANTNKHYSFSLTDTQFNNCQSDTKNKITEAQVWLNANIFHINYINITNNDEKIDASAFLFTKYVKEHSTLSFFNGINQRGFTSFEIYDVQGDFIHMYSINMINTTFTNFKKDSVMDKIAFFNVYFNRENSFYLDTFIAIDFTTISTDGDKSTKEIVEPVIVQIPDNSKPIISFNIFSTKKFSDKNKIEYKIIQDIKYEEGKIIGILDRVETPSQSPLPSATPGTPSESQTPSFSLSPSESETLFITESQDDFDIKPLATTIQNIQIEIPKETSEVANNNDKNSNSGSKNKMKGEVIAGIVIGIVVFAAIIVIVIVVVLQRKRNSLFIESSREHFSTEGDNNSKNEIDNDENNESSARLESDVNYQNNKFWKNYDPLNLKKLISSINSYECSADEEDEHLSD